MTTMSSYSHGQFCWVDLAAHDMDSAAKFYSELFGWDCRSLMDAGEHRYSQFEVNGQSVAGLAQMSEEMKSQGVPPMWSSYINVDDIQAVAAKVTELSGVVIVPVMQVDEAGWLAFFQDPTGGQVGLWQGNLHKGAMLVNAPGAFCWNELATRDVEKAREFFGQLLGWDFSELAESPTTYYVIKNAGRDNGGLMQMNEQWGDMPPNWSVYFMVEDADATAARLRELDGNVCVEPFDIPVGRMAVLADPQGAAFSVIKLNQPPD